MQQMACGHETGGEPADHETARVQLLLHACGRVAALLDALACGRAGGAECTQLAYVREAAVCNNWPVAV